MQKMNSLGSNSISNSSGRLSTEENDDDEISRLAISAYQAKEEEIERKKMEVKEKVELQLGRAGEETRRLAQIWEKLEVMGDPMRKELANVRKKIDMANRELKPLGLSCQKKEKEYKEALERFNEKNKEKAQLVTTLMELLTESEKLRMQKLEELSKNQHSEIFYFNLHLFQKDNYQCKRLKTEDEPAFKVLY
ncbi:hypothetical protein ACFX15_027579 [Malus domestica]|uniref:uncharacterized protein n=1 Tax=Malus domestica TaxID=3750 RepID=UPI0010AA1687|nr:uncharacterized protein LOC103417421 [Malus domestica]XP_050135165.1 uncharacterized protein LOC126611029 isoform X1 [Malus sylvestris]